LESGLNLGHRERLAPLAELGEGAQNGVGGVPSLSVLVSYSG
jgi:hypothetical protein